MPFRDWMHGVGQEITGLDPIRACQKVGLDWEVRAISTDDMSINYQGRNLSSDGLKFTVRMDNGQIIDKCTHREPWQNVDVVRYFYQWAEDNGLQPTHLGFLKKQSEILMGAKLPITSDIKKCGDITDYIFLLRHSHRTGNGMPPSLYTSRRICTNGTNIVINNMKISVRHSGTLESNQDRISNQLQRVIDLVKVQEEVHNNLAEVEMTKETATVLLIAQFGDPKLPIEEQPRVVQACLNLFLGNAAGSEYLSAYNTAYGLLQSVSEYYNWNGKQRQDGSTFASLLTGARQRAIQGFEHQLVGVCLR